MDILSLTYRRPQQVDKDSFRQSISTDSFSEKEDASLRSGRSGASAGIPDALAFDKIISGGTCPVSLILIANVISINELQPMTVRDFMNYLIYIEHSAENLQFFLWHRDYVRRFREAKTSDISLAPEWTEEMEEEALAKIKKEAAENLKKEPQGAEIFRGTDFEKRAGGEILDGDPFTTPPQTPLGNDDASTVYSSHATTYRSQARETFSAAGSKQPCMF